MNAPTEETPSCFVGRGGLKLDHAIREFALNVTGLRCADFGCNVGGFTDCLLQHGAAHVVAIDTGYGVLDYKLRIDDRVMVMERTNILHMDDPAEPVDLVVIDAGWTPQALIIPVALRWIGEREGGRIVSLIKPHYERSKREPGKAAPQTKRSRSRSRKHSETVLDESEAETVCRATLDTFPTLGAEVLAVTKSPIRGGAKRGNKPGNIEYLALLAPAAT